LKKKLSYIVLSISLLLIFLYFSYDIFQTTKTDVIKKYQDYEIFIANDLAEDAEKGFGSYSDLLQKIGEKYNPSSDKLNLDKILKDFPELRNEFIKSRIVFYNPGGKVLLSVDDKEEPGISSKILYGLQQSSQNLSSNSNSGWRRAANLEDNITPVFIDMVNSSDGLLKNSALIYSPIYKNSSKKLSGIIAIKVELDKFLNLKNKSSNIQKIKYDIWMIDKEGNILYGPNHPALKEKNFNKLNIECRKCHVNFNFSARMLNKKNGVIEYPTLTDEGKAAAFSTMYFNNAEWRIVVTAPSRQITESVAKEWSKILILLILVFFIIAVAIWYVFKAYRERIKTQEEIKHLQEKEYLSNQLVEKGKEYEELFENNPMPMWVYDLETLKFLLVNRAAVYHYGYSQSEFLSMNLKDIRPETEMEKLNSNLMLPENEIEVSNSWLHKKKDGTIINVEIISHSLPAKNGLHSRLVMAKDVTEKYRLNIELEKSEQKYKQLVEHSMVGILISDNEGKIQFANSKACELLNYNYEELISLTIPDTYTDDEYEVSKDRIRNIQTEGTLYFERKVKRKDGSFFYADVIASKFGDGKIQSLINDITNKKKAEEELHRSEKQYKAFFEDDLTGVFSSDPS
jgi:PAS domain S-box-containing protein